MNYYCINLWCFLMSMTIWHTVSLWGDFLSISTMNFYVLKNPSTSWKWKTKNKNKAFAEKGVRELVQENNANVYLAISLSKLSPKHYAPPWLCCSSDKKLIRTQRLKFFFYNCSASPSQGATGQKSGPTPSSLSNYSYVHNF